MANLPVVASGSYQNLLSADQASFETSVSGWGTNVNCASIAQSTAHALDGVASMLMTSTSSGACGATATGTISSGATAGKWPAIAGLTYTALGSFLAGVSGANCFVQIQWRNSSNTTIGSVNGPGITSTTSGWTQAVVTASAPVGTVAMLVVWIFTAAGAADTHYVDCTLLAAGRTSTWQPGGQSGSFSGGAAAPNLAMPVVASGAAVASGTATANLSMGLTATGRAFAYSLPASYSTLVKASQPLSYLRFDEAGGNPIDIGLSGGTWSWVVSPDNLPANDSGFETSVAGWTANTNCSIAQTTAQAHTGTHSLAMTSTASGSMRATGEGGDGTSLVVVVPGTPVIVSAWVRAASTTQQVRVNANWYNSSRVYQTTTGGTFVSTESNSAWNQIQTTATAPAGTGYVSVSVEYQTTSAGGEVHYVDDAHIIFSPTYAQSGALSGDADTSVQPNGSGASAVSSALFEIGLGSMSWELWFKTTQTTRAILYRKSSTSNADGCIINLSNGTVGQLSISIGSSGTVQVNSPATTYADGNWHYLVGVLDRVGGNLVLYVDGSSVGSISASSIAGLNYTGTPSAEWNNPAPPLTYGQLDEAAIYGYALSAAQVAAHYAAASVSTAQGVNAALSMPVVASGAAVASGSIAVALSERVSSAGAATSTGTLAAGVSTPFAAQGVCTSSGVASLVSSELVVATGSVSSVGTASPALSLPVVASGAVISSGTAYVHGRLAVGLASLTAFVSAAGITVVEGRGQIAATPSPTWTVSAAAGSRAAVRASPG